MVNFTPEIEQNECPRFSYPDVIKTFSPASSRQKTLVGMIVGAMSSNDCQHHSLARHVSSRTHQAAVRKVERFFQQEDLTDEQWAKALVECLHFKGKFDLC
ncbi:MAG: hypothetical protein ACKO96_16280, partial [Flammeovirgaceae bacterium]